MTTTDCFCNIKSLLPQQERTCRSRYDTIILKGHFDRPMIMCWEPSKQVALAAETGADVLFQPMLLRPCKVQLWCLS